MTSSLKDSIKEYYEGKSLSREQVNELLALQKDRPKHIRNLAVVSALSVAVVLLAIGINNFSPDPLREKIVQEIAYNHNKKMEPEVLTDSLSDIRTRLKRLDFNLIQPESISSPDWTFVGGRYCSIQGKIAAQLKLRNQKSGEIFTLYQLPMQSGWRKDDLVGEPEAVDGVTVKIWPEKGLLLGLAGP